MTQPFEEVHIFIVRIWPERREIPGVVPEWRGTVEKLDTNEKIAFRSLDKLMEYIAQRTGMDVKK